MDSLVSISTYLCNTNDSSSLPIRNLIPCFAEGFWTLNTDDIGRELYLSYHD